MAKEPDQTRWVGVRPTDPSEDIPTTTKKVAPAIGDLQAVKDQYAEIRSADNRDCSVSYIKSMTQVVAGELWIVTSCYIVNITSMCDITIQNGVAMGLLNLKVVYNVPVSQGVWWNGFLVLQEDDYMCGTFKLGGVTDDVRLYAYGYKIGLY